MIQSRSKYYFSKLPVGDQEIYKQILTGWANLRKSITVNIPRGKQGPDVSRVIEYIFRDNPGLFFINRDAVRFWYLGQKMTIEASFYYDNKQIAAYETRLRQEISKIMARYSVMELNDYEKALALHDCLAKNVKYEYESHSETSYSVLGGLLKRKTVCEGFANTYKLLCDEANIDCIVVLGTATPEGKTTEGHAWNIIRLGMHCYHIDVTWDSCAYVKTKQVSHSHLNMMDSDAAQDHQWDKNLLPPCNNNALNYYVFNKTHFATEEAFKLYFINGLKNGQKSFEVRFENKPKDQIDMSNIVQRILQSRQISFFSGYSYTFSYDAIRGTVSIQIN